MALKSVINRVKSTRKGKKTDKLRKKLVSTRKRLTKAQEDRATKEKRLTGTKKPVRLGKTFAEEELEYKKKKIKRKTKKFLNKK